jgi:Zn-dependent peptidase ImmA (M78 family)/transcriptional regulator with XRE-family HTH domain
MTMLSSGSLEHDFSGPRLRLARAFKDLTQAELGERASVTSQYIGYLENGRKQPTAILVDAFANVLGFEPGFFYGPPLEEFRETECHFRKRATTPVGVRTRVLAHGTLFGGLVEYLDDSVSMPPENVPRVCVQHHEDIERAAETCRMQWGLGRDLPSKNLTRAVEHAGVIVTRFEASAAKVDAFSRSGRRSVIVLNVDKDAASRSRFDLAHECGHLVMHDGLTTGDPETEKQANQFASALLLPRVGFVREFPRSHHLDWAAVFQLKKRWGASASAIVRRAYDLRLIPATTYQSAYKAMAYRGWLKSEPEEPLPETPELVPLCIEQLRTAHGLSLHDMARHLSWGIENFEIVTGIRVPELPPTPDQLGKVVSLSSARHERAS